jgi:hypothetical protein
MFVATAIAHSALDIPYITTGGGGTLTTIDRDNARGDFFKLTSTFNNGNIYGVCALMALPLVTRFQKRWKSSLVKLSIILTLSRTAWVGLLLYEFGHLIWFARSRGEIARSLVIISLALVAIIAALFFIIESDLGFIFDPTLGGRDDIFDGLAHIYPFSINPFEDVREIVYVAMLTDFGYVGLAAFLLAMFAPFACRLLDSRPLDQTEKTILFSMVLYLALCCSDGAILLIPVMLFYWGLSSFLLASGRQSGVRQPDRPALPAAAA